MRVNTNMNAMIAHSNMTKNTALSGNSMEKISSGLRITKAGDDAAGLAISEKMRAQIKGLEQASRNTQDGISLVQTAEGAMEEIGNITQRMRELAVQSSTATNTDDDRAKIQGEMNQLSSQINNIASSTKFNGQTLLNGGGNGLDTTVGTDNMHATDELIGTEFSKDLGAGATIEFANGGAGFENQLTITVTKANGDILNETIDISSIRKDLSAAQDGTDMKTTGSISFESVGIKITVDGIDDTDLTGLLGTTTATGGDKTVNIQTGANNTSVENMNVVIKKADTTSLGINSIDVSTQTGAKSAIDSLDGALQKINTSRADLGATQNRLEYTNSNLASTSENLTAAESRIRDVDVAKEMMNLSKLNILNQAAQAMMGQAKQQPEGVLQLLR